MAPSKPSFEILVVDDVGYNRILIDKILTNLGHIVEQAATPTQALKALAHKRFDLVLTDLQMPEMDGVELFEKARETKHFDDHGEILCPPFILCTAFQDTSVVETAIRSGFVDVLLKPVEPERLKTAVKNALQTSRAAKSVTVNLEGMHAMLLGSLAEAIGATPQQVVCVMLEEVTSSNLEDTITDTASLAKFLRAHLRTQPV